MATYSTEYRYKIGDKVLVKNDLHEALTYSDSYKMRSGPRAGGWPRAPNDTSLLQELL